MREIITGKIREISKGITQYQEKSQGKIKVYPKVFKNSINYLL